jgi:hypothetical protein
LNSPEFSQVHARFEELYWGRLEIVESDDVASEMVAFRDALDSLVSAKSNDEQARAREKLQDISLDSAYKCRETVGEASHRTTRAGAAGAKSPQNYIPSFARTSAVSHLLVVKTF